MAAEWLVLAAILATFGIAYHFFQEQLEQAFNVLESTKETGLSVLAVALGLVFVASGATWFVVTGILLFLYGIAKLLFKKPYEEVWSWIQN